MDNLFITTKLVKEHPVLREKYKHPFEVSNLFNKLLQDKNYTFFKKGRGDRKYICKKGNEDEVKSKILKISKIKSENNKIFTKSSLSEIDEIKNYLDNYVGKKFYISQLNSVLLNKFDIKLQNKRKRILNQLIEMKRLESLGDNYYKVLPSGEN